MTELEMMTKVMEADPKAVDVRVGLADALEAAGQDEAASWHRRMAAGPITVAAMTRGLVRAATDREAMKYALELSRFPPDDLVPELAGLFLDGATGRRKAARGGLLLLRTIQRRAEKRVNELMRVWGVRDSGAVFVGRQYCFGMAYQGNDYRVGNLSGPATEAPAQVFMAAALSRVCMMLCDPRLYGRSGVMRANFIVQPSEE